MFGDFLRYYWFNLIAIAALVVAFVRFILLGEFNVQSRWLQLSAAFAGMMMIVASDEFSEWTGGYGMTRKQWIRYPTDLIEYLGLIAMTWSLYKLFA